MAHRRKDPMRRDVHIFAKAAGVVTEGDLLMKNGTSKNVTSWTTGSAVLGICTKTQLTGDTTCLVDILKPGDWVTSDVTGTPASGDIISCDLSATNALIATNTNHDALYIYNSSSTTVDICPKKLETTNFAA